MKKMRAWFPLLALTMFVPGSVGHAQTVRTIAFRGGPTFNLTVPMGYSFDGATNSDGSVRVVMENPVWGITIRAVFAQENDPNVTSQEWQKDKLITFIAAALSISREDDYAFRPLDPETGSGIYCNFTVSGENGRAASGAATRMTGGLRAWQGSVVVFQIICADFRAPEYREAFETFKSGLVKVK